MAQIVETVSHTGTTTDYSAPVGKKIYGFTGVNALDIAAICDGVTATILSNAGQRELFLPCPIEFKASTVIRFTGSSIRTVGIIRDE